MSASRFRRKRWISGAAAVAAASLLLAGCAGGPATSGTEGEARDLIIARAMDVSTLDISRSFCDTCQIYNGAVYEPLLQVNPDDITEFEPLLASSWEANDDNTVFTFELNPDAVFADGTPVESSDVKWTWERLKNLQGSPSFMMAGLESIETPDAATVVATFAQPNSAFLAIASSSYTGIINSELAEENGATADADAATTDAAEEWFLSNSAGSGQYVLSSYSEGESLVLERNENYWGTPAVFPGVTIKEVSDASSQLQQLEQGDVDIAMQLSFDALDRLSSNDSITSEVVDSYNFVYVALSPGAVGGEALADAKVREAIKKAIDYDGVIDATLAGNGKKQAAPIPNGFEGTESLELPTYDPEGAEALLAEAGYADGLTLDAVFPNIAVYGVDFSVMFQSIQQDLAEVGIDLNLTPVEFSAWIDQITGNGIPVTSVYYAPDHTDSSQYAQYFAMIDGSSWQGRSGMPISQTETDLLALGLSQDGEERTETYTQLGQAMMDDLIILPIANPQLILASSSDITGVNYHVTRNIDLSALALN